MACPAIELRERGRAQLAHYDNARVVHHTITAVEGDARSGFTARSQGGDWHGRALVLATGVLDHFPAGTRLAIAYAARFPDRLAALLLITPPASYLVDVPSDASTLAADRMVEPPFAAAVSAFGAGPDPSSDETFNAWQQVIAPIGYARWSDTEQAHARRGRYSLAAARAFLSGDAPADLVDRLREVLAPTLVIAGAQDAITGVGPVLAVADLFPNGHAAVIEHCGHNPWVEQPASFREVVDPFLAQLG